MKTTGSFLPETVQRIEMWEGIGVTALLPNLRNTEEGTLFLELTLLLSFGYKYCQHVEARRSTLCSLLLQMLALDDSISDYF